jgi:hypothetical protein
MSDPVVRQQLGRVESYFPDFDILLLEDGAVVAGGWGVPLSWDGTVTALPARGYDGALAVTVSRDRQLRRARCAGSSRDRPRARYRHLAESNLWMRHL